MISRRAPAGKSELRGTNRCSEVRPQLNPRALEIVAFDEPISAEKGLAWGLVNEVVPSPALSARATEFARRLTARSLHAFGWSKQLLNESLTSSPEAQLERERQALAICGDHPEGREGLQAFAEKRRPVFGAMGSGSTC